uniref:acyl-CoA dehydrogenase family protein n=1 Tax=Paracoccus sp. TaxID=267 RepID=UPI00272A74F0
MIDFTLDPRLEDIRRRTRDFVDTHILPVEADRGNWDAHDNIAEGPLQALRARARAAGLWCPQVPQALGGMGLPVTGRAVMYEEANRSIFGPAVFNCAAPDDGNMDILARVGTPDQQARWLAPLVAGEVRSSFVMTEPAPGGGSDP